MLLKYTNLIKKCTFLFTAELSLIFSYAFSFAQSKGLKDELYINYGKGMKRTPEILIKLN